MISILVNDITPISMIMLLSYLCGKFYFFDNDQRQGLNKLVLDIALPAALFISIAKATRKIFAQDIVLTLISIVGVVRLFMLGYYLDELLFHRTTQQAVVCTLITGSPTIGFLGFAVLDPIHGNNATTNLVIGAVSIVVDTITIPLGLALINKGQTLTKKKVNANPNNKETKVEVEDIRGEGLNKTKKKIIVTIPDGAPVTDTEAKALKERGIEREINLARAEIADHTDEPHQPMNPTLESVISAIKQPAAAAPLITVILVLIGIRILTSWTPAFDLIAKANAGVAVLVAGLALSTVKFSVDREIIWNTFFRLFLTPAVIVTAAYLCGMGSDPTEVSIPCLTTGLPPAFSGIIISSHYNIYAEESVGPVAVSTIFFVINYISWIWLLPILTHMF